MSETTERMTMSETTEKAPENPVETTEETTAAPENPVETTAGPDPYTDYNDAEAFPYVLTLATGEKVGSPSAQSTHHYSRELEQDVPVIGVLAR